MAAIGGGQIGSKAGGSLQVLLGHGKDDSGAPVVVGGARGVQAQNFRSRSNQPGGVVVRAQNCIGTRLDHVGKEPPTEVQPGLEVIRRHGVSLPSESSSGIRISIGRHLRMTLSTTPTPAGSSMR